LSIPAAPHFALTTRRPLRGKTASSASSRAAADQFRAIAAAAEELIALASQFPPAQNAAIRAAIDALRGFFFELNGTCLCNYWRQPCVSVDRSVYRTIANEKGITMRSSSAARWPTLAAAGLLVAAGALVTVKNGMVTDQLVGLASKNQLRALLVR
jgi:hypothetical protein